MKKFAKRLKEWRKLRSLTQHDASVIIGVNINTYRGWEQQKHEPIDALKQIIINHIS